MIYLVVGDTGAYSDYTQWNVCYYHDQEQAELHARLANDWLRGQKLHLTQESRMIPYEDRQDVKNPFDSACEIDYTGTNYFVEEVAEGTHAN